MAARSSVWQPAGNRSPRSHGKADSTFEAHAANRRFRSRIRWIFPARPCSLWARKPITRPSPVISSTKSMCSSIGTILHRNASTCSSHCRRYADGVPNFRLPTFSIFETNAVDVYGNPQISADRLTQSALDAGDNDNVTAIYRKAHCKRYVPSNNAHVPAMTIVNNRICHVISAYSIQYLQNTR